MKHKIIAFFSIFLMTTLLIYGRSVLAVNAFNEENSALYSENISVAVNCTSAELSISSIVLGNATFVHFPTEIDIGRAELTNVILIGVGFSRQGSVLLFIFNNTDTTTATSLANAVKDSIEPAFETSFTWNSTGITEDNYVNVTYTGSGESDLPGYLNWLMGKCLAPDLGGFTLTFIPMSNEMGALILVSAYKESGSFDWVYSMGVVYSTSIPVGAGEHKIDFLDLLNVESLAPSLYASYEDWISSTVSLTIISNETVSYVSSEPGLANLPEQLKGWYINLQPPQPPAQLIAYFSFGDDPNPIDRLSFTFSGLVIPEFTMLTPLIALMSAASIALVAKKKISK